MTNRSAYGGQAVIEGVMIRGKERVATACRLKDGTVTVRRDMADSVTQRFPWLRLAFLRGTPALIDSMKLGYRTLMWSADVVMEDEKIKKPSSDSMWLAMLPAMLIGIGLFVVTPVVLMKMLSQGASNHALFGKLLAQFLPALPQFAYIIAEGVIRVLFLVLYILAISLLPDIRRVFAYHGAEHKVVNAYEVTGELTVETAKRFSRIHPRCGTSFIFLFFVVGIFVHAIVGWPDLWLLILSRVLLIFPIAGVAYELIRLAGKLRDSRLMLLLVWPGLLLQRLTTAEPTDDQIEVAIASLRAVLEDEGELAPETPPDAPPLQPADAMS